MKINDIMSSPVWCVRANDDIAHARKEMVNRGVAKLVVLDGDDSPVGVLTASDMLVAADLRRAPARRHHLQQGKVEDAMSMRLYKTDPQAQAAGIARELARRDIGTAPVVEDDKLVGLVTPHDLLPVAAASLKGAARVRDVMTSEVPRVHRHDSVASVGDVLIDAGARAAVVVESGPASGFVGLVTRESLVFGDVFEAQPNGTRFRGEKRVRQARRREVGGPRDARYIEEVVGAAEDLMLTDVPTIRPDADVEAASNVFINEGVRALPVVEGDAVVGLVSKRDILRAYAKIYA